MQDKVHSAFFRELYKRYSFDDIKTKLKFSDVDKTKSVLKSLKSAGIVKVIDSKKAVELERLQEEEIITDEIATDNSHAFVFNFVGIAYTENSIIKCYPKYVEEDSEYFLPHFKQVLQVLKKYNNTKDYNLKYFDLNDEGKNFNRMEIELFILEDYFENGIYTNQESVIETNGSGEIDWDRTINSTLAIIKNNKPYYVELQTINTQNNDEDFFKLLHECILTECSHHLGKNGADILELFDMEEVELSGLNLSDFGDTEYIKYRIEQELRNQFVTQKQNLLKILLSYVTEKDFRNQKSDFSFFGTNAFNMVWEKSCSAIFDDVKDKKIGELERLGKISFDLYQPKDRNKNLLDLIEKASWVFDKKYTADDTLLPDIITIENNAFHILDGKYYLIKTEGNKIYNQPGIQDVVKQFAYHKAYYNLLQFSNLTHVSNSFLVPKLLKNDSDWEDVNIKNIGQAELNLMQSFTMETLCPINVVELHPKIVYNAYLSEKKITDELKVISATEIVKNVALASYDWKNDYIPTLNFTVVGLLREKYMERIRKNGIGGKFYFYFYRKINKSFLPVQNLIPCCQNFIGRNKSANFMVQAKITEDVKTMTKCDLDLLLEKNGFGKTTNSKVSEYYVIEMQTTGLDVVNGIDEKIKEFEENMILSEYSPKVIAN